MTIPRFLFNALKEDCDWEIRDDYSGRFMFGKPCFAIIAEKPLLVVHQLCQLLKEYEDDDDYLAYIRPLLDALEEYDPKLDQMGLEWVVYFPNIQVEKEKTDETVR